MITKRVRFFLISILFLLVGAKLDTKEEDDHPAYTQYVAEITCAFSKQITKEFGLECVGSGGCMPYDVEEIFVKFFAYQRATIDDARELEIKLTERFVEAINAHEKIRPFLKEYPFPASRAIVGISFCKKNNMPYTDGSVAYVSQIKNKIYYRAENPIHPHIYDQIKNEPYEEALKIVLTKNSTRKINRPDGSKAP